LKFKLNPNSLFAVLLRSPWWISITIGIVFIGASFALLPPAYWVFGAMGGVPFWVIGGICLVRQVRAPSEKQSQALLTSISAMSWREFSALLEKAYQRQGYSVVRIHGAADFAITRAGRTTLVAAKRWKAARQGVEGLQALHGAVQANAEASDGVYVAIGEVSEQAARFAKSNGVGVAGAEQLVVLLA
jgi:restriction system protein